ncbi:MAG: bifunctional lysylphosphatidylglycerol flippase/synthetase MprF [Gemmatimonadota bacterium]|nr:bifunctional lysylphosphatidylglycerol flippase/synthetase MprF [Gemmatimonadota bacterium]
MTATPVHYLIPSIVVTLLASGWLLFRKKAPLDRVARVTGRVAPVLVPRLMALLTFLAGAVLLFSGATPAVGNRLHAIDDFLPLPVVEVSHLFGSLTGVGLLILARGLQRRLAVAYTFTVALLAASILFSLLKALDYEEALFLSVMLAVFVPNRKYFHRRSSLIQERFTRGWIGAITLVVAASVLLGFLSYRSQGYSGDLLFQFAFDAQAPRFLRATVAVMALLMIVGVARLIRPATPPQRAPSDEELARAERAVARSPEADSHLVFLRDKSLLFNDAGTGFVMYAVAGRSWVSMGDPVAPSEEVADLTARFVDLAVRHGGWPVFYKVGRQQLYLYLDFGLALAKLGEEARVRLEEFSLDGPKRRNIRRVWRKAVDEGCRFELVAPERAGALRSEMRGISDRWMEEKQAREKGFSLGFFDEEYVARYPIAVVRRNDRIVAFANVWRSGQMEEIEADLMRYDADAPPGVMRYLLAELMLWGRSEGYRWFNLGMAPLSGLRKTTTTPLWNQMAMAIFDYGERWYNFQGLRNFKEWFYPEWEPKYLVSPGGALRPVVLANIAALVAGGIRGVVKK